MAAKTDSGDVTRDTGGGEVRSASLPVRYSLTPAYVLSMVIALFMTAAAAAGILLRADVYPTEELLKSFFPNDIANLVIGVPILVVSMWLARRGKLIGLLCWPGALLYGFYNSVVPLLGLPYGVLFLPYLILTTLTAYTMIILVAAIDGEAVEQRYDGPVPARTAGAVVGIFAILFALRVIGLVIRAFIHHTTVDPQEIPLMITDFLVTPAWLIGGIMLWRRHPLGYVVGPGLLFQAAMLFFGVIVFLALQSVLTASPVDVVAIILMLLLGLTCFIPFLRFARRLK